MKYSKILKRQRGHSKCKCEGCNRVLRIRHISFFKGKDLCTNCIRRDKNSRLQESSCQKHSSPSLLSLDKALSKVYTIDAYVDKNGKIKTKQISLPMILIGHKIKFQLVE